MGDIIVIYNNYNLAYIFLHTLAFLNNKHEIIL